MLADYILKLKNRVNEIVEPSKKAVENLLNVTDCGSILNLFREVTELIGSADTKITLLQVDLACLGDFIQDKEVEYDNDMSNTESKNAENCMLLQATQMST